jgi:hypothetical protein
MRLAAGVLGVLLLLPSGAVAQEDSDLGEADLSARCEEIATDEAGRDACLDTVQSLFAQPTAAPSPGDVSVAEAYAAASVRLDESHQVGLRGFGSGRG